MFTDQATKDRIRALELEVRILKGQFELLDKWRDLDIRDVRADISAILKGLGKEIVLVKEHYELRNKSDQAP